MTPEQIKTLRTAIDRIIPADNHPSAGDAGIDAYLASELRGDLKSFLEVYRYGLDSLSEESRTRYDVPFSELGPDDQDVLLSDIEVGNVKAHWTVSPSEFFSLLVTHVMDGYYGTTHTAFEMVGFDPRWTTREFVP